MTIKLRERLKNGKIHFFLDIYHEGKRKVKYIGVTKHAAPSTREERSENRKSDLIASELYKKYSYEMLSNGLGVEYLNKRSDDLFTYILGLIDDKKSEGNIGNWKSMLNSIRKFVPKGSNLQDIDAAWVLAYKRFLITYRSDSGRTFAQNTQVSYFNKLKATLKEARKQGLIKSDPSENVESIKPEETVKEVLTKKELRRLAALEIDLLPIEAAFLFGCYTGLRWSDIEKLDWSEIRSSEQGFRIEFTQKKTGNNEFLPIPIKLMENLGLEPKESGKVFPRLQYSNVVTQVVRRYLSKAGIQKNMTFHNSRDTFATIQLSLGVDIYTVSKMLGHRELKTTQIYAQIVDDQKVDAANKLNELL